MSDPALQEAFLTIPSGLAGTLVMRPATPVTGEPVKGLTGADIALWLVVMDMHGAYGPADGMRIEQHMLTSRFGRITRQRMNDAMRRLMGTEVYLDDEDRWVACIDAYDEHPMERVDPRVPVAPEWTFFVDRDLVRSWWDGIQPAPLRVPCAQLRELTSRYAVAAWLRFLVWPMRKGIAPPDHWNLLMPTVGTGMRTDVPVDELGDLFGYEEKLPPSKVQSLFVTGDGVYPVVRRELIRVGVDIEVSPLRSTWHNKPVAYRVRMGSRYLPLENLTDGRWTEDRAVTRPKRGKWGKRKIAQMAIARK